MTDYQSGFGNGFETEALPGALPAGRNSPQNCPYGLYAEQLSGSPFTAPRASNERSWLYRIRPSVAHWGRFTPVDTAEETTFITGVRTITTGGDAASQAGFAGHVYTITTSMADEYVYNGDAEMVFVLEHGHLRFCTEFGIIDAEPGQIVIIPRRVKMRVEVPGGPARGYLCENYGGAFALPEDTFRPPWYHMNIMSEFMGLIRGVYDAKPEGFLPGGISLHNCMMPHGPDATAFEAASTEEMRPVKQEGTLAFMFETRLPQRVTAYAAALPQLQKDYADCWSGLRKRFDPDKP